MSEFDEDVMLHGAFAAFRTESMDEVKPAGTDAVRVTVRHQRRVRHVAMAALALVMVAAPVAAYASLDLNRHGPPANVGSSATPDASAEPTPSESPSQGGQPGTSPSAGKQEPVVASVSREALGAATLDLPAWPEDPDGKRCAAGPTVFVGGRHFVRSSMFVVLGQQVDLDTNHDGTADMTAVTVTCEGQLDSYQVVAFTRTEGGAIHTVGRVVGQSSQLKAIYGIEAGSEGTVKVEVGDLDTTAGGPSGSAQHQTRTYGYDGQKFAQVDGPTTFPKNPKVTDLSVSTSALPFGAPVGDKRTGRLTATVRNLGQSSVPFTVVASVPLYAELVVQPGCVSESYPSVRKVICVVDGLAAGASRTFDLEFTAPSGADQTKVDFLPGVSVVVSEGYVDAATGNNGQDLTISFG